MFTPFFPGFFDSDREIFARLLCALAKTSPDVCVFVFFYFSSFKIFRKMWTTLVQFFSAEEEKRKTSPRVRPWDGHVEHVCKNSGCGHLDSTRVRKNEQDTWYVISFK